MTHVVVVILEVPWVASWTYLCQTGSTCNWGLLHAAVGRMLHIWLRICMLC